MLCLHLKFCVILANLYCVKDFSENFLWVSKPNKILFLTFLTLKLFLKIHFLGKEFGIPYRFLTTNVYNTNQELVLFTNIDAGFQSISTKLSINFILIAQVWIMKTTTTQMV